MSVFKEGRVPQPDPTTGDVEFLLDDLSDEMRARISRYLWHPGDYGKCTYQPKINQFGVCGTATRDGKLYFLSWFALPTKWMLVYEQEFNNVVCSESGKTPSFLFEFHALYAEK
jgi:hypothetical protein